MAAILDKIEDEETAAIITDLFGVKRTVEFETVKIFELEENYHE